MPHATPNGRPLEISFTVLFSLEGNILMGFKKDKLGRKNGKIEKNNKE